MNQNKNLHPNYNIHTEGLSTTYGILIGFLLIILITVILVILVKRKRSKLEADHQKRKNELIREEKNKVVKKNKIFLGNEHHFDYLNSKSPRMKLFDTDLNTKVMTTDINKLKGITPRTDSHLPKKNMIYKNLVHEFKMQIEAFKVEEKDTNIRQLIEEKAKQKGLTLRRLSQIKKAFNVRLDNSSDSQRNKSFDDQYNLGVDEIICFTNEKRSSPSESFYNTKIKEEASIIDKSDDNIIKKNVRITKRSNSFNNNNLSLDIEAIESFAENKFQTKKKELKQSKTLNINSPNIIVPRNRNNADVIEEEKSSGHNTSYDSKNTNHHQFRDKDFNIKDQHLLTDFSHHSVYQKAKIEFFKNEAREKEN